MSLVILGIKKLMYQSKNDTSIRYKSHSTSLCDSHQIENCMNTNANI
jgi:hypothetical protein